ncbi:MAG TPA: hypothetical protein V6D03_02425 [Candidatus Caenarcaniphilales bacterium]
MRFAVSRPAALLMPNRSLIRYHLMDLDLEAQVAYELASDSAQLQTALPLSLFASIGRCQVGG